MICHEKLRKVSICSKVLGFSAALGKFINYATLQAFRNAMKTGNLRRFSGLAVFVRTGRSAAAERPNYPGGEMIQ
jgi:hypothetical protein